MKPEQKHKKKDDYYKYIDLYIKQKWLNKKSKELTELIDFCANNESKDLVFSLLDRFHYIDEESLNMLLNHVTDYIIDKSGFEENRIQLLSLTWDDDADSGQKILDSIKHPIFKKGWRTLKTVNIFTKFNKNYSQGKDQIIIIDEFLGSGKTLRIRIDYLRKNIVGPFELKCCFIAGIEETIEEFTNEGIEIFCPLQLEKGISQHYSGSELSKIEDLMLDLELKLAQKINEKELFDYSFGYGGAEALYTLEGCNGNTPNSVFPIFWWLRDKQGDIRNTILTRYESGF